MTQTLSSNAEREVRVISNMRAELLGWFAAQQRALPWRETKDPYSIWLSEIMLQQTRVETVKEYYKKFLKHFPTVQDLANADISDVLTLWAGLGYYRRARNLHKTACTIVEQFGGVFPNQFEDILSLSGIGRYTAGAISSIAFGLEYAAVDGNVHRVMSRLFCIDEARGSRELDKQSWHWAEQLVPGKDPGAFNQSLMELGAMICTPRSPTCMLCPIQEWCQAHETGQTTDLPRPKPKKAVKELQVTWGVLKRAGKILLIKRPDTGLFAGMWELPGNYADTKHDEPKETLLALTKEWGLQLQFHDECLPYTHILTHRKLNISIYHSHALQGRIKLPRTEWRWVASTDLHSLPISSITKQILEDSFA